MTDQYDKTHQETGSGNISKATPEWSDVLWTARARGEEGYVLHTAYDIVNEQVKQGIVWSKCANCGSPYKQTEDWTNNIVCSYACHQAYVDYINDPMK